MSDRFKIEVVYDTSIPRYCRNIVHLTFDSNKCTKCCKCLIACHSNILSFVDGEIRFRHSYRPDLIEDDFGILGCESCDCVDVCPTGALSGEKTVFISMGDIIADNDKGVKGIVLEY